MPRNNITRRWFLNTFCVICVTLFAVLVIVGFFVYNSYEQTALEILERKAYSSSVNSFFEQYIGVSESKFRDRAYEFAASFPDISTMEVWMIDRNGVAFASSSGFPCENDEEMPDYEQALSSDTLSGTWTGKNINGEKIMAITTMLPFVNNENSGAVRYMISVEAVDSQFVRFVILCLVVFFTSVCFVAVSGLFFIRSIVLPVKKINESAKKLAAGDFKAKIESHKYDDEIGELCDTFNAMAVAIGESDKMKNDFISTVSHELRTPLTAIKGWAETIADEPDTETLNKGVSVIISETERLNEMVEDLLDFSKIESGRMSMRFEKIDGIAELDETIFVFIDRAERDGIELDYESPQDIVAPLHADANRIRQVYVNILDNALKYTGRGGKIAVAAAVGETDFIVTVSDSGCGIPPEVLPHVKEKFYKANSTVRGSGIGLAVCEEIIRLHSGKLMIDSVVNEGTTVVITLPLMR